MTTAINDLLALADDDLQVAIRSSASMDPASLVEVQNRLQFSIAASQLALARLLDRFVAGPEQAQPAEHLAKSNGQMPGQMSIYDALSMVNDYVTGGQPPQDR